MEVRTIAIAGLGLIGGSLARDCAARGIRVLAFDRDPCTLGSALGEGVIHGCLTATFDGIERADLFVVATPVDAAPAVLAAAAARLAPHTIVTDACSTKRTLEAAATTLGLADRFVGAHPMAGDACSGWAASRAGLFHDATVYLCPTDATGDRAMMVVRNFWNSVGGRTESIAAHEHDVLLASTSHLPQLTATALARVLMHAGIPLAQLGPGGRDMTRLAHSSAEVWTAIALDNRVAITAALSQLEHELAQIRTALETEDAAGVHAFFCAKDAEVARRGRGELVTSGGAGGAGTAGAATPRSPGDEFLASSP